MGGLLLYGLGAPAELMALEAAMLVTLGCLGIVTAVWKVSVHTTVSCGGLVVLAIGQGAWACLGLPLIGLIGWSRVRVGAHTPAQTVVGSLPGAAIGGLVFACAR